jgi:hypothetical protein
VDLPEFNMESVPEWEKFLLPLVAKKIDLKKLPPLKLREYDKVERTWFNARTGKSSVVPSQKKNRKRYPSDLRITDVLNRSLD